MPNFIHLIAPKIVFGAACLLMASFLISPESRCPESRSPESPGSQRDEPENEREHASLPAAAAITGGGKLRLPICPILWLLSPPLGSLGDIYQFFAC